jgi:hypothetical protein
VALPPDWSLLVSLPAKPPLQVTVSLSWALIVSRPEAV